MARVSIVVISEKGTIGDAQTTLASGSLTSSDPANDHEWLLQNGDRLLVLNTSAGGLDCALIVQTNRRGRTTAGGTSLKNVPAGDMHMWGPLQADGWAQTSDGKVQLDVNGVSGDFKMCVLRS